MFARVEEIKGCLHSLRGVVCFVLAATRGMRTMIRIGPRGKGEGWFSLNYMYMYVVLVVVGN